MIHTRPAEETRCSVCGAEAGIGEAFVLASRNRWFVTSGVFCSKCLEDEKASVENWGRIFNWFIYSGGVVCGFWVYMSLSIKAERGMKVLFGTEKFMIGFAVFAILYAIWDFSRRFKNGHK